jgi:inositol-1,4,5-trisphosphate 5-phosphatase
MFDCYRVSSGQFLCRQSGVFRTNCLDCLDRTNYVQSRLALRHFKLFLGRFGDGLTMKLVLNRQLLDLPVNENYPILKGFNSAWADNGEALSLLYTGIGSTHTEYFSCYLA